MVTFALRLAAKILTVVLYAVTIGAAFGGSVNPHIWGTPSILTLAFPYLAMATLIATLLWAVSRRLIMAAVGVAVMVAIWSPFMSAFPFGSEKTPSGTPEFSLLTFNILDNVNSGNPDDNNGASLRYVLSSGADIVCLQELGSLKAGAVPGLQQSTVDSLEKAYPYRLIDGARCLTLLSKYPAQYHVSVSAKNFFADIYSINVKGKRINVVNAHLASYMLSEQERKVVTDIRSVDSARRSLREFKGSIMAKMKASFRQRADEAAKIRELLDQLSGTTIVCGDFNDVPASWAYKKMKGDDFTDAFAETNFGHKPTYHAHCMPFHIDQVLYRGDLRAIKSERIKEGSSDHYPVMTTFEFAEPLDR